MISVPKLGAYGYSNFNVGAVPGSTLTEAQALEVIRRVEAAETSASGRELTEERIRLYQRLASEEPDSTIKLSDPAFTNLCRMALRAHPQALVEALEAVPATDADYELMSVMQSVDKWFDDGDPRLNDNPATRASHAREIALKAIENEAADVDGLVKFVESLVNALGPYPYINGTSVVYDAHQALSQHRKLNGGE